MDWYWLDESRTGDRRVGPLTEAAFIDLVRGGGLQEGTLVWNIALDNWRPWSVVRETDDGRRVLETVAPTALAETHVGPDVLRTPHPAANPAPEAAWQPQPSTIAPSRPAAPVADLPYASVGARAAAAMIDWLVTSILFMPIGLFLGALYPYPPLEQAAQDPGLIIASQWPVLVVQLVFNTLYHGLFVWKFGGSPGKMMLGLRIVSLDSSRIGLLRSFWRHIAAQVSNISLGFGYLVAIAEPRNRALHDMMAGTVVLRN